MVEEGDAVRWLDTNDRHDHLGLGDRTTSPNTTLTVHGNIFYQIDNQLDNQI